MDHRRGDVRRPGSAAPRQALLGIDRPVQARRLRLNDRVDSVSDPEVVAFVEPEGYLVTRLRAAEVAETGRVSVAEAAELLRRLHDGPPIPGTFDSFRVVEAYAKIGNPPADYEAARAIAERIEARRLSHASVACHNDLLPANFVHGERLWLVDWEYAGMGDPAFDLANFAVSSELDPDARPELLDAYGGADAEAHALMRFMSDFREAMWGVVQQAISTLDFDFDELRRGALRPPRAHGLGAALPAPRALG